MGDSSLTLIVLLVVVVVYLVSLAIYRLYLHPLSRFPGPKLAALTNYWELYQDFFREESGYLFIELDNLHNKYGERFPRRQIYLHPYQRPAGPIVRIRPNEVHVKDSNWMDVLYTGPSDVRSESHSTRGGFLTHMCNSLATVTR